MKKLILILSLILSIPCFSQTDTTKGPAPIWIDPTAFHKPMESFGINKNIIMFGTILFVLPYSNRKRRRYIYCR